MKRLLLEAMPFKFNKSQIEESISKNGGKLLVSGVLQRANAKNQNGRVYPRNILEREVNKYEEKEISERRALGELDHPECFSSDTEILTESGWKLFSDISDSESIYTLNPNSMKIEIKNINKKIDEEYEGKLIRIRNRNIDIEVTPSHRFYLLDRYGNGSFVSAIEIFNNRKKYSKYKIPKSAFGGWEDGNQYTDFITLSGLTSFPKRYPHDLRNKYSQDLKVNPKIWFSFLGLYLAEGHYSGNNSSSVIITQNTSNSEWIRELLSGFPSEVKISEDRRGKNISRFRITDRRISEQLRYMGKVYDKLIPTEYKNSSKELLENLYSGFRYGDGTVVNGRESVFTISEQLAKDLEEVAFKTGRSTVTRIQRSSKKYKFAGREIDPPNKSDLYRVWTTSSEGISLDHRMTEMEVIDYSGKIYCVSVENEIFYARRNNLPFWTGNSSVVNLKNVSHNILEVWWDGDDLCGKIEVLDTPSGKILKELFKAGITLGISSRGLGSVKNIQESDGEEYLEVQDDFEFVCWDFVSNPSTHGAFMAPVKESIKESRNNRIQNDNYTRANSLITEIICELSGVCCI